MEKHIIDRDTISEPANMRIAEGRTALDYPKRLECRIVIEHDTLESQHYFQVFVSGARVVSTAWLDEAVKEYNKY